MLNDMYEHTSEVHFASFSEISGANAFGLRSGGAELVERRYAIIACSSANMARSVLAINVAKEDADDALDGIWVGV